MSSILFLIYVAAGYWATGQTIYKNKIIISSGINFFMSRLIIGGLFGMVLIPWALLSNSLAKK